MMKKFFMLLAVTLLFTFSYTVYAETAYPTEASVIVDGKKVNFCAYNLYGSNYFMLREVAMSLVGTEKQFDVEWSDYRGISLYADKSYQSAGTEFLQSADGEKDALFSVPDINLGGDAYEKNSLTLVGYNIAGSNYFKIRDIARIFDFYVGYSDGYITIDTSRPYEFETPYEPSGEVIGMAHESDLPLFINEMPIISYYSAADAAYSAEQIVRLREYPRMNSVYVSAEDMDNYGFDKAYDGNDIYLTRNKDKQFGIIDGETINSLPSDIEPVYKSDFSVYLDGEEVRSVFINGKPYISVCELLKYGSISENIDNNAFDDLYDTRINIDFLEYELEAEFDDASEAITVNADMNLIGNKGTLYYNKNRSLMKYKIYSGLNDENYYWCIGGRDNENRLDGYGIRKCSYRNVGGVGVAVQRYSEFSRGLFEGGSLADGISYSQRHIEYGEGEIPGTRTEGARINGYKRESEIDSDFRFGYCMVCEGTIENGEYCGYYCRYDDTGKLIFEGNYADYINQEIN